ncbi:MAG: hypothetical protein PVJ09_00100 [Candidatus Woesebacteria bacterium]|jgi:hypothetical protein
MTIEFRKENKSKASKTRKTIIFSVFIALFFLSIAGFAFSYWQYSQAKKQLSYLSSIDGQREMAQKEIGALLEKVKKHIVLPDDEQPIVATITDIETLAAEQAFYQGAENGDKVLIFVKAKKALIYSPSRDILVNVGPAYMNAQQSMPVPEQATQTEEGEIEEKEDSQVEPTVKAEKEPTVAEQEKPANSEGE